MSFHWTACPVRDRLRLCRNRASLVFTPYPLRHVATTICRIPGCYVSNGTESPLYNKTSKSTYSNGSIISRKITKFFMILLLYLNLFFLVKPTYIALNCLSILLKIHLKVNGGNPRLTYKYKGYNKACKGSNCG